MGECLPRRVPPDARKRIATIVDKMTPGASPKAPTKTVAPTFPGPYDFGPNGGPGPLGLGTVQFWYDHWATQGGPETFQLAKLPMTYSEHVYWNGIEQQVGTDYTLSGSTLNVLTAMATEEDDLVEVRYAYITGATIEATIWDAPISKGGNSVSATNVTTLTVPLPTTAAGDLALVAVNGAGLTTWPGGWNVINNGDTDPAGWAFEVGWKIAGASEPNPTISGGPGTNFGVGISGVWDGAISVAETGNFPVSMNAIPDTAPYTMPGITAPTGRSVIVRVVLHKETTTTNNLHGISVGGGATQIVQENGHRAGLSMWAEPVEEPGASVPAAVATATSPSAATNNGYYTALYLNVKGG